MILSLFLLIAVYNGLRSNPDGTNYQSREYIIDSDNIDFLYDLTSKGSTGKVFSEQEIFDRIFSNIDRAERYILLDMFLFNSYTGNEDSVYRNITGELVQRLINKKESSPDIKIDFITDPINAVYGGAESTEINLLKRAGINVIYADVHKLRDSNLLYSPIWRLFFKWFGNSQGGFLPNPFSSKDKDVSIRSYLELLNFKANHRKVFVSDYGDKLSTIVTSANPHDGSSAHSNVAFEITGDFGREVIKAERAVAEFSGASLSDFELPRIEDFEGKSGSNCRIMLVTENRIEKVLLEKIDRSQYNDSIDLGMFYLSDRDVVTSLIKASKRGTKIRIILDPNKDAFGREKNGIPNRQTAHELVGRSKGKIKVRWYNTHGEQYHSKLVLFEYNSSPSVVILGSANFTRRNLDNYNLELNVCFSAPKENITILEVKLYFDKIWGGEGYTTDYSTYEDDSDLRVFLARFLELTGVSTF